MLDDAIKNIIKQAFSNIKNKMPNFVVRYTQNKMLAETAKTIINANQNNIICIEAPTGVGKTIAYLLSAIPIAKHLEKTLIISTATVALQEQLIDKDLPDIQKYSLLDFNFKLVKGRSRYVCIRNLTHIAQNKQQATLFDNYDAKDLNKFQKNRLNKLLSKYDAKSWNGEIDSLDYKIDNKTWNKVQCNHNTCGAKQCDFYHNCCFFNARKHIFSFDVLVANHDLVLADLISGNNALPMPSNAIYIFDEAHHLGQKALSHFQYEISLTSISFGLENHTKIIAQLSKLTRNNELLTKFSDLADKVITIKNTLSGLLDNYSYNDDNIFLFRLGIIDDNYRNLCEQLLNECKNLFSIVNSIINNYTNYQKTHTLEQAMVDNIKLNISIIEQYFISIIKTLELILIIDNKDKTPNSRWVLKLDLANNSVDYVLYTAKIDIANDLKIMLWDECSSAILTSATLSSLGNFDRLSSQLGLLNNSDYFRLSSPFDFTKVNFIIANIASLPNDKNYDAVVAKKLLKIIAKKYGTLVLFTSNKQMQAVAQLIADNIGIALIMQGEASKQDILNKHKKLIDNNKASVIFGVDSFYEGVDLPYNYLTHVIIVKLKFSVPSTPIEKTNSDYLESKNINSFIVNSLPDASLKLIQASGRLIRSEIDTGKITLLDRRIITKQYGKQLLSSLPNFNIIIED